MAGVTRKVKLEMVADWLGCDPKRLVIALRHLAETPSIIEYAPGFGVKTTRVLRESGILQAEAPPQAKIWIN